MPLPAIPKPGQPAAKLVDSASVWGQLLDMLAAYERGEFDHPENSHIRDRHIWITNASGAAREAGEVLQIEAMPQPASGIVESFHQSPAMEATTPVWHSAIDKLFVLTTATPNNQMVAYQPRDWVSVKCTAGDAGDRYVMIDPANPTRFKTSDAGLYRILEYDVNHDIAVVDLMHSQPLWRYELKEDSNAPATTNAKLLRLDGVEYASQINLSDSEGLTTDDEAGDTGYCLFAGGKFIAIDGDKTHPPRIRFQLTSRFVDRVANAVVKQVVGTTTVEVDDNVTITDPRNHWCDAAVDATGWANWYEGVPEVTGQNPAPEIPARWEIETASSPINEVWAYIENCLLSTSSQGVAHVHTNDQLALVSDAAADDWILSPSTHRDLPFEFTKLEENGDFKYQFTFENPDGRDAVARTVAGSGSGATSTYQRIRLKRVTNATHSDPSNNTVPKAGVANAPARWIVVDTYGARFARNVKGQVSYEKDSGNPPQVTGAEFSDGVDPTGCGAVTYRFECEPLCDLDEECFEGRYDPDTNEYVIDRTTSAVLGTPTEVDILGPPPIGPGQPCNVRVTQATVYGFCPADPTELQIPLYTTTATIRNSYFTTDSQGNEQHCTDTFTIDVCSVGTIESLCTDIEPFVCPEPGCDDGCEYRYDGVAIGWTLIKDCPNECPCTGPPLVIGDPPPVGTVQKFACSAGS
jgi:hypothetical protein